VLTQKQITLLTEPGHPIYQAAFLQAGRGVPLLLLHGFLGDATCWLPLVAELQTQVHCVSLDLLGFGESAKPKIRYDIAQEVAFLRQAIQALDLESCYIVGHSFGGWVAAAYALAYPKAVKGLILVAAAGIRDDSFCGKYDHLRFLLWQTPIVDWSLRLSKPLAAIVGQQAMVKQLLWFRQELMANPAACSFLVDRLRSEDAIDTVEQQIHQLRVPTLVITGDRDETIPLWHSETYAREIPNAKLVVLPNADHALPQNHASELATQILPFILS
jgi:pimeloyl-ACP methyl ester carboxylesterase